MSKLFRRVYTIERHKALLDKALVRFEQLRLYNITGMCADGSKGWPLKEQAPFDRIIVTAVAFKAEPIELVNQLAINGIMILPIELRHNEQYLVKIVKKETGIKKEFLEAVKFVPLVTGDIDA